MTTETNDSHTADLAEVWGDTVDLRHLAAALPIGIGLSVGAYLLVGHLLAGRGDAQVGQGWALLAGLGGCLLAGVLCARLFRPKRIVVTTEVDSEARREAIAELCAEPRGLGQVAQLPPSVRAELEQLGLRAAFEQAERDTEARA